MPDANHPLIEWLRDRGHNDAEIEAILARLSEYDHLTTVDAIMDAISTGEIDIDAVVNDMRKD